ncbi:MAG: InlB B-repeat-containing protein [Lachnospiraceae bacterium]|nr:InlB B-repeat-containing protein [Lachnospiraceae bacterium]
MKSLRSIVKWIATMGFTAIMFAGFVPGVAHAADVECDVGKTTAPIIINSSNVNDYKGKTITGEFEKNGADERYFYTPYSSGARTHIDGVIVVDGVDVSLTIDGLNIKATAGTEGRSGVSPILLLNGARLNLTLKGENHLTGCWGGAGICVSNGCSLTINGDGTLYATGGSDGTDMVGNTNAGGGGAGIGMRNLKTGDVLGFGEISIEGGTIIAQGGSHYYGLYGSAGIGGSERTIGGSVFIKGGDITATGGAMAAGIGGGGEGTFDIIKITGGKIRAVAGKISGGTSLTDFKDRGAAIGCGYSGGNGSKVPSIKIDGGSVVAEGNIGHPDTGTYYPTTINASENADVVCSGDFPATDYVHHLFNITIYDTGLNFTGYHNERAYFFLKEGAGEYDAGTPGIFHVKEDGVGTLEVGRSLRHTNGSSRTLSGRVTIKGKTYYLSAITVGRDDEELSWSSGYTLSLTGNIYDSAIGNNDEIKIEMPGAASPIIKGSAFTGHVKFTGEFSLANGATTADASVEQTVKVTDKTLNKTWEQKVTFKPDGPNKKNARLYLAPTGGVSYIDENGEEQICADPTILSEDYLTNNSSTLESGWYYLQSNIDYKKDRIKVKGDVKLILGDSSEGNLVKLNDPYGISVNHGNTFTVYGQKEWTGELETSLYAETRDHRAAIGGDNEKAGGTIAIYGGKITAYASTGGAGIGAGGIVSSSDSDKETVVIVGGGIVSAYSKNGYGLGSGVGSNGKGSVTLGWNRDDAQYDISNPNNIPGCGENYSLILKNDLVRRNTSEKVSKENLSFSPIVPATRIVFDKGDKDATGNMDSGTCVKNGEYMLPKCRFSLTNAQFLGWQIGDDGENLKGPGSRLTNVPLTHEIRAKAVWKRHFEVADYTDTENGSKVSATTSKTAYDKKLALEGEIVSLKIEPAASFEYVDFSLEAKYTEGEEEKTLSLIPQADGTFNFVMPHADVSLYAKFVPVKVKYIDAKGNSMALPDVRNDATSTTTWGVDNKTTWYVAEAGKVTSNARVEVKGDVNLLLMDNADLQYTHVNGGINVPDGATLTIWAQSAGEKMGKLTASTEKNDVAAIGGDGNVIINGGNISATAKKGGGTSGFNGPGLGRNVTINGGKVYAQGGSHAAGIGGGSQSYGTVTINGGNVTAKGGEYGAGIGCGWSVSAEKNKGIVTITGGVVDADCEDNNTKACGIGCGYSSSGGTVVISGGTVKTGSLGSNNSDGGTLELSYSPDTKRSFSLNAWYNNCSITMKNSFTPIDRNGRRGTTIQGSGTVLTSDQLNEINISNNNKSVTWVAADTYGISVEGSQPDGCSLSTYVGDEAVSRAGRGELVWIKAFSDNNMHVDNLSVMKGSTPVEVTKTGDNLYSFEMPEGNVSVSSEWTKDTYTVRFNGNGSTSGEMADETFEHDQEKKLTANAYNKSYTVTYNYNGATSGNTEASKTVSADFGGWSTEPEGNKAYDDKQSVSGLSKVNGTVISLYALWGDMGSVTLPAPEKTDCNFIGWCKDPELSKPVGYGGDSYIPDEDITLYAKWADKEAITPVILLEGWTYGSEANDPKVSPESNPGSGDVSFEYYMDEACSIKTTAENSGAAGEGTVPKKGGKYYIKAKVAETGQYKGGSAVSEFTIAGKPVTVTGITAIDRKYEAGNLKVSLSGGEITSGLLDGETATVDLTEAYGTMADADAGENKPITVTGVKLGGANGSNYSVSEQPTGVTVNIAKAPSPVNISGKASVIKGGKTLDLSSFVKMNGATGAVGYAISGEDKGCSIKGSILTSGKTEGTINVSVTVASDKNYEALEARSLVVTITAEPVKPVKSVSNAIVSGVEDKYYTGKPITQTPTVRVDGLTLKEGRDYSLSYKGNVDVGTATMTITGKGNYTGTKSVQFTISLEKKQAANITYATVTGIADKTYTGKAITQKFKVMLGTATLKNNTDYTVTYKNNKNAGTATVTLKGKGKIKGKKTVTFKINKAANPLKVTGKTATVKQKNLKKKSQTLDVSKVIKTVKQCKGKVTYVKDSGDDRISINKKTGKVTVKKGTPKGNYSAVVNVTAAGDKNYNSATRTVTITVKVS